MSMFRVRALLSVAAALALGSCNSRPDFVAKEEPWRADEERSCLTSKVVQQNPFVTPRSALGGPSVCGALQPFEMSAAVGGRVAMRPAALLRCQMVPAVDTWVSTVVQPAVRYYYGSELVELKVAASYGCRPMNNVPGAHLSEHGHANAIDISAFVLADGRQIAVKVGYWGPPRDRAFLRSVHQGGCRMFSTVLGPEFNAAHRDHFHLDLARHGRDGRDHFCK